MSGHTGAAQNGNDVATHEDDCAGQSKTSLPRPRGLAFLRVSSYKPQTLTPSVNERAATDTDTIQS